VTQTITVKTRITAKIAAATTVADAVRSVTANDTFAVDAIVLADGDGADEANRCYVDARDLAASGSVDYDLDAGTLEDSTGRALVFDAVKAVGIRNATEADADFVVSGNLFGSMVTIPISPGGLFLLVLPAAAGRTVSPGQDTITVTNQSAEVAVSIEVFVLGVALSDSGS